MNCDTIKCPVPNNTTRTHNTKTYTQKVCIIFEILNANIVKMIFDIQYLKYVMQK